MIKRLLQLIFNGLMFIFLLLNESFSFTKICYRACISGDDLKASIFEPFKAEFFESIDCGRQYGWNTYVSRGRNIFNRCWIHLLRVCLLPRVKSSSLWFFACWEKKMNKIRKRKRWRDGLFLERHGARSFSWQGRRIWLSSGIRERRSVYKAHCRRLTRTKCRHARGWPPSGGM